MGADDDLRSKEGIDSLAAKLLQFADKNPQQHGYMAMDQYLYNIFRGMNIHVPAILMFTRGIGFWPIPTSSTLFQTYATSIESNAEPSMGHQPRMGHWSHWVVPFFPHGSLFWRGRKLRLKLLGAGRFQGSRVWWGWVSQCLQCGAPVRLKN